MKIKYRANGGEFHFNVDDEIIARIGRIPNEFASYSYDIDVHGVMDYIYMKIHEDFQDRIEMEIDTSELREQIRKFLEG